METMQEWQFDGLVGPTHNYAGLAFGNVASHSNAGKVSNPKEAALQGLRKMKFVRDLGIPQAFLPPHYRPYISELTRMGYYSDKTDNLLSKTYREFPQLLASVYSSSFMWTANAATITPSCDSQDSKLHITPANMSSHYHRSIEASFTQKLLSRIFHNTHLFCVHNYLFSHVSMGDEGAANHMLVCSKHGLPGAHFFVVGDGFESHNIQKKYPLRQRRIASRAVSRLHKINASNTLLLQQSPEAIEAGVFHNDVIAFNTTSRMVVHEAAFIGDDQKRLREWFTDRPDYIYREVSHEELPIADSVSTYLFNSQFLALPQQDNVFALIAPAESEANTKSHALLDRLIDEGVLQHVHYLDLRESMRNGGGPACLRLRIPMSVKEAEAIHPGIILTNSKFDALQQWVSAHYRDRLHFEDFKDPEFVRELNAAYTALETIIDMPGLYQEMIAISSSVL